jgi:hypothetical protein
MSIEIINGHVLLPELPEWQGGVGLSRRWQTVIEETVTGAEDRGAMRAVPRLKLSYDIAPLTVEQRARFEDRLREALKSGKAAVPFWGRASDLATNASGTSAELATTNWPWQVGDFICFLDATNIERPIHAVRQITAKTGLALTLNSALPQTFAAGSLVWPLLFGKPEADTQEFLTGQQSATKFTLNEQTGSTRAGTSSAPTYLSRPIFTVPINWTDGVSQRLSYDLRELQIGFGAEVFAPLQEHVVHGFEFSVQLNTETEILALESFFAALHGRLHGFWLPAPAEAVNIVSGLSTTQFDIADQDFTDTWENHPAVHLRFTHNGTSAAARILSVADNGDGTERVTLESALPFTPDNSTLVNRLHYVRLTEDTESASFLAEWFEQRKLKVVELPTEYAETETGEQPVYLYDISIDFPDDEGATQTQHWRYTSFATDIVSLLGSPDEEPVTYQHTAINHGDIRASTSGSAEKVSIKTVHTEGHPFLFGFPYPPSRPIKVRIYETTYGEPDEGQVLFTGQVQKAPRRGKEITATCISILDLDGQRLPGSLIGPRCAFHVYDPDTCGVARSEHEIIAAVDSYADRTLVVSDTLAFNGMEVNYLTFGWIEYGTGLGIQIRPILEDVASSSTVRTLTLNLPLSGAVTTGSTVKLLPGCDGKLESCQYKFFNDRFMGHPFVPKKNPTLAAIDNPVSQGGKK